MTSKGDFFYMNMQLVTERVTEKLGVTEEGISGAITESEESE